MALGRHGPFRGCSAECRQVNLSMQIGSGGTLSAPKAAGTL